MPLFDVLAAEELVPGRPCVVLPAGRAIALFRIDDEVHALEDECPRDGFALSAGELGEGTVRCGRHGGRFDLATGRCLRGGEDARRYHARIEGGRVHVLVEEPLAEVEQARLTSSLRTALIDGDEPRLARESVRLLAAGAEPRELLRLAVRYGTERGAGGFNRSLAACADFARAAPLYEGLARAVPLVQALTGVSRANRGRHQRPIPAQARGVLVGVAEHRREAFARLVEARDAESAEAMLSGALYQGMAASEAQQWLFAAAGAHPRDGGLVLVSVVKALELCEALGMREAVHVLPPLVPPLVYGLREDDSGPLFEVSQLLERHAEQLPLLVDRADALVAEDFNDRALRALLLDGSGPAVFDAVLGALQAGVPPVRIGSTIAVAASERLLRFDPAIEWDDARQEGWEDALRPLLHAAAATRAVQRWAAAPTLRMLFHAAARVQATRCLDAPERRRALPTTARVSPRAEEAVAAVAQALRTRAGPDVVPLVRGCVEAGHNVWRLAEAMARVAVEDGPADPTQAELGVMLVIAAIDTWESAGDQRDATLPLLAAARYLGSEVRHRWCQREVAREMARQDRRATRPG